MNSPVADGSYDSSLLDFTFTEPLSPHEPPLPIEAAAFPSIIDNSMISDFRQCEQRWFYKHCRKLALLDENVHLVSGGAYARGLEVTRRRYFDDGWPFREALRAGIRAAILYYGPFEPHGRLYAKNIWRIIGALEHHFTAWPIDARLRPYKPPGSERHAIEFSFAEPIHGVAHPETGDPLLYSGRCDFIGIDEEAGLLGPVDDKSTSQLGDLWYSRWDLSNQMYGYIWASRRVGYPSVCAFIRGVSILKTKYANADARTYADDAQLRKFEINLTNTVKRMVSCWHRYRAGEEFPFQLSLGGACVDFGGCGFKTLCESSSPESWIPVNFTVNTWSPLDSRD